MFFLQGDNWQLGAWLMIIASFAAGASFVVYDAILVRIAGPDDRDRVSSRGWAWGYLGGGLLLALNFGLMSSYESLGISYGLAIRLSLLSAGLWWGIFTIIPVVGLRKLPRSVPLQVKAKNPFAQLGDTFRDMRNYPQTVLFLLAFLFFNDGIQTVIVQSSLYASAELGMETQQVLITFLLTQMVAFGGALLFGRIAAVIGAKRTVIGGIAIWLVVVVVGFVLPVGQLRGPAGTRRCDRAGDGRHPGAGPLDVQPAGAAGTRIGVLQLLPGHGAGYELVGHPHLRTGLPVHPVLPARTGRPCGLLRRRRRPADAGGHAQGNHRRRQRVAKGALKAFAHAG